jgi:alkylation response protein AidB-like acyl-CoA dehydrogenase
MAARLEAARAITAVAALEIDADLPGAAFHAAAAKALADRAARTNAAANVQNHGGIGFTWDQGAHLLVSRAEVVGRLVSSTRAALHDVLVAPDPATAATR